MRIRSLNHIIWCTRYRKKFLQEYVKPQFLECLYKTVKKYPTLYIHSCNTDLDHTHLQIEIPPSLSVAAVVQKLKIETSIHLKKKFKFIREMYLDGSIWSVGYFVSTIGLNEEQIRKYIAHQGKKDIPRTQRLF